MQQAARLRLETVARLSLSRSCPGADQPRYRIVPLSEILTLPFALSKLPVKDSRPLAPAKVPVPPVTEAVPENETLVPPPAAQAWAFRARSLSEPLVPESTALPLKVRQVSLVKLPCPAPLSRPGPIGRPWPLMVALPEALVPLV
jgi:hypothetical protein